MVKVYNKHHKNAPASAVYIGRGSVYGNPFVIGTDGNRTQVIQKYISMLESNPERKARFAKELAGKDLVCFCKPAACHGDYLLLIASETHADH